MLKKTFAAMLSLLLIASLAGCDSTDYPNPQPNQIPHDKYEKREDYPSPLPAPPPENTPIPLPTQIPIKEKPLSETEITIFENTAMNSTVTLPESWSGQYFMEENLNQVVLYTYEAIDSQEKKLDLVTFSVESAERATGDIRYTHGGNALVVTPSDSNNSKVRSMVDEFNLSAFISLPNSQNEIEELLSDVILNALTEEDRADAVIFANHNLAYFYTLFDVERTAVPAFALSQSALNNKAHTVVVASVEDGNMKVVLDKFNAYKMHQMTKFKDALPIQNEFNIAKTAIVDNVGDYAILVMSQEPEQVFESIKEALTAKNEPDIVEADIPEEICMAGTNGRCFQTSSLSPKTVEWLEWYNKLSHSERTLVDTMPLELILDSGSPSETALTPEDK